MNKVLLTLNGPMCSGKSTVAAAFMKKDGFFKGSYDNIKFLISNYSVDNPEHRRKAREITLASIAAAMEQGLSVVVDGGNANYRDTYKNLSEEHDFQYLSINIEAPYDVLKQRFLERVERGEKVDRVSITVTTLEGFDSRYEWYEKENRDTAATAIFDSSVLSVEEIVSEIVALLE